MNRNIATRYLLVFAAWLPFYATWVFITLQYGHIPLPSALSMSLISMGSASLLGIAVWHLCKRWPWPLQLSLKFYLFHFSMAVLYAFTWCVAASALDSLRSGINRFHGFWHSAFLGWEILMGAWLYGVFAGVSYAIQTRNRLHEKETLASRAEALVAAARLDAIRARLNPHFLFNALHTLSALAKFRPEIAENAIERLGDMLRYTLKEDGRELVEFSEEYEFTRHYIAFEQLRYEDRLKIHLQIEPASFSFDVPPFCMQTLAENAVHHAISVRPEGGSIWITTNCKNGNLIVTVQDDGPGQSAEAANSHQFGLRSLRERLHSSFGPGSDLNIQNGPVGFCVSFSIPPSRADQHP
jgi:two-component system LytT family sensor kinase